MCVFPKGIMSFEEKITINLALSLLEMLEETGVVFENELPEYFTGLPALLKKEGIKNKATFKGKNKIWVQLYKFINSNNNN